MSAILGERVFGKLVLIPFLAWLAPACESITAGEDSEIAGGGHLGDVDLAGADDPARAGDPARQPGRGEGKLRRTPVAPLAPTADTPMYQGTQRDFQTNTGGTCRSRVAASMGNTGFCYLAADDSVKCSGVIGGVDYGLTPTATGQRGAEQIMLFFGVGDGMCITKIDRTVQCMGTNTNAFGDTLSATFSQWTARNDFAAIATGTWDQVCGITTGGQVYCGGTGNPDFGNPPIAVGAPGQSSLWVDTFGIARLSDASVLRPAESRTECQVRADGLSCYGTSFGPTDGTVVSGVQMEAGLETVTCWLDSTGTVGCSNGPRFAPGKVLFLAASYYSDSMCAIYNDGSIWCIGSNDNGKLGTGDTETLETETMVAPPGSARVRCD